MKPLKPLQSFSIISAHSNDGYLADEGQLFIVQLVVQLLPPGGCMPDSAAVSAVALQQGILGSTPALSHRLNITQSG